MSPPVKPEQDPGHVPTGAEWAAAQYGPHRFGQDPTAQLPMGRVPTGAEWDQMRRSSNPSKLTFPALPTPKFVADQTKRLNPNAGAPDKSIPEQLGEHARHVAAGIDVLAGSTPGLPIEGYLGMKAAAAVTRQAVAPALEHPAFTAATIGATAIPGVGPLVGAAFGVDMLHNVAKYGYQTVHEYMMTPEERAIAQQDPNRISTEAAVVQIGMLGLMGLGAGHAFSKVADVSQGMTEAGAAALRPYVQSPVGATQLGAAAAEFGLPSTANPYQPGSNTGAAWRDGYEKQRVQIPGTVEQATPETPAVAAPTPESTVPQRYNHEGKVAIVTPSAKEPGKWQATYFNDAEGTRPAGDIIADTPAAAIKALEQKGYSIPTKPKAVESLPEAVQAKYNKLADYESQLLDAKDSGDEWTANDETKLKSVQKRMRAIVAPEPATTAPAAAPPVTPPVVAEPTAPPATPTEPVGATPAPTASGLTPIEGTGETRTRGLATSTVSRVAEDIKSLWGDLPEYQRISISEQAHRAQDLITADPVRAKSIAMGDEPAPIGLHAEAVFVALRNKARAEGDVGLIHDLATGGLTEQATTMGQKLRLLAENDPEDPVAKIRRISDKRSEGRGAAKAIKSETDVIAKHTELNLKSLMDFFESQKC